MILFKANGRCAACVTDEPITTGSNGIRVTFELSEVYADLAALAVFRGSGEEIPVILLHDSCTVPPGVLTEAGGELRIGVYARDAEGTIAVPTVWATAGPIRRGTTPDLPDEPPTPDWTAQVELALQEAVDALEAETGRAAESAEEAGQSAEAAAGHAEAAAASAEAAEGSAQAAAGKAAEAGDHANDAQAAKRAAEAAAEAAGQSAEGATLAAGAAGRSAEAAAAALTEVETKGAQQIAAIEQAGGEQVDAVESAGATQTAEVNAAGAQQVQAVEDKGAEVLESIPEDYTALAAQVSANTAALDTKAPAIYETVGPAAIASFDDGADGMTIKTLTIDLPVMQEGSGDPSPENVRPIVGRTGCNVYHGRESLTADVVFSPNYYYNENDGLSHATSVQYEAEYLPVNPGEDCLFLFEAVSQNRLRINEYDGQKNFLRQKYSAPVASVSVLVAPSADAHYFRFSYPKACGAVICGPISVIPIPIPTAAGTVYGGNLTINSDGTGALTVTEVRFEFDGTESWALAAQGVHRFFRHKLGNVGTFKIVSDADVCSHYTRTAISSSSEGVGYTLVNSTAYGGYFVYVRPAGLTAENMTEAQFKALLADWAAAGTPLQITASPAEPTVYPLDADQVQTILAQLKTLYGTNNIWSDAGDVTVEYPADTKLYIDGRTSATRSMIAGIETDMTASRAYSVGELLIVGDTLFKVIAAIASGATLTPGTNVSATTVVEQLLLLANA